MERSHQALAASQTLSEKTRQHAFARHQKNQATRVSQHELAPSTWLDYLMQNHKLDEAAFAQSCADITASQTLAINTPWFQNINPDPAWLEHNILATQNKEGQWHTVLCDMEAWEYVQKTRKSEHPKNAIYFMAYTDFKKTLWKHRCGQAFTRIASLLEEPTHETTLFFKTHPATSYLLTHVAAYALWHDASDIHIEAQKNHARIRCRVDGMMHRVLDFPLSWHAPLLSKLKLMAQCDITEKRLPQDGRLSFLMDRMREGRMSSCPGFYGEKMVIRILQPSQEALTLHELGFQPQQEQAFIQALKQQQGLILVTGPTGSGKSMTLYSAMAHWDCTQKNICSVEDPVEIPMEHIHQVAVNNPIELHFSRVLRSLLRQDPDIIVIGEIRDQETARIALQAAHTGHLVLASLHTHTPEGSIQRLRDMGIANDMLYAIECIIAQRLLRCLCPSCKIKAPHAKTTQDKTSAPFKANSLGCPRCAQGYRGRTGAFVVLEQKSIHTKLRNPHAPLHAVGGLDLIASAQHHLKEGRIDRMALLGLHEGDYLANEGA